MDSIVIIPNTSNELRTGIYADYYNFTVHMLIGTIKPFTYEGNVVMGMNEALHVPDLSIYYYHKIGRSDKRIWHILTKLLYINKDCNAFVRKQLIQHVLRMYVQKKTVESDVGLDKTKVVPVLTHEELRKMVSWIIRNNATLSYQPDKKVYHLLFSGHNLSKEQKLHLAMSVRNSVHKRFATTMVDNAVDWLIEYDSYTQITTSRIHKKELVKSQEGKPVSYNTIKRNYSDYAIRRIEDTDSGRIFKDEDVSAKLTEYMNKHNSLSLNELTRVFGISKNTARRFKIEKDGQIFNSNSEA